MGNLVDLTGRKFGRLTVIKRAGSHSRGAAKWLCVCSCEGVERIIIGSNLTRVNGTVSCGCHAREVSARLFFKHGERTLANTTKEYRAHKGMLSRCFYKGYHGYQRYGGRGITVCERWLDFPAFLEDMGRCPPGHSLDRIDNDGNYEPGNCRWSTAKEQAENRYTTKWIILDGRRVTCSSAAVEMGFNSEAVRIEAKRLKISHQEACDLLAKRRRIPNLTLNIIASPEAGGTK